jgi:hypothetical protein
VSAKRRTNQHAFAVKVSETLAKLGIPEAGVDKHGNPHIAPEYLPRLPHALKADLFVKGHWRVIIRSNPHEY